MIPAPIRRPFMGMPAPQLPPEPSVETHLSILACGYKGYDCKVDREKFAEAMERNQWLKTKVLPSNIPGEIAKACDYVDSNPDFKGSVPIFVGKDGRPLQFG